ncbi:hypothetical protein SOM22_06435 [Stenotrophomonas rhizophila]|uniref:hypothetical protein n=1 Tax=Stenotrophomonas rhizophila TaxID=216778 RepID=UPI002A6AAE1C|nr:hypothetical protein [Stenotrophomonas rhizophila]MDY0954208.1 hypothetical protein [Stenotrophomonas rhizophila]
MNAVPAPSGAISIVLHHIDVDGKTCTESTVKVAAPDLQTYLEDLLAEISTKPQRREFDLESSRTQFAAALESFFAEQSLATSDTVRGNAEALAQRLLAKEIIAEERYGHLGREGAGLLNKGSFLQFLFRNSGGLHYIGVKVEHQLFLDEVDFSRHIGIGESNKIYKACMASFDDVGAVLSVLVFDTNYRLSRYWWSDFWELKERRSDAFNTATAVTAVVKALSSLKKHSPSDYTILRNATVAAFKQQGSMNFIDFVASTFEAYQIDDPDVAKKYVAIVDKIKALPSSKDFDTHFDLHPPSVPYKRISLPLSEEVSVSYDEDMANISEKIWASETAEGKSVVVVEATKAAADRFVFKPME